MIYILRNNKELAECLSKMCDVDILQEYQTPDDEDGHIVYSISGRTFAVDGCGGDYILLDDESVGFSGSDGIIGRIADNIQDFLEFVINCPYWSGYTRNYIGEECYNDISALTEASKALYEEDSESWKKNNDTDMNKSQKYLAEGLGVKLYSNIAKDVLMKFYNSATREPKLYGKYTEDDGSTHIVKQVLGNECHL